MAIIVGYIPTAEGRAALRHAAEEAELRNLRLVVVGSHEGGRGMGTDEVRRLDEALAEAKAQLDARGIDHKVRALVRGNDPSEDIIAAAEEEDAQLIVIGVRRRSAVGKLILGSNAQRIILDATCPVIAVKPES